MTMFSLLFQEAPIHNLKKKICFRENRGSINIFVNNQTEVILNMVTMSTDKVIIKINDDFYLVQKSLYEEHGTVENMLEQIE